MHCYEKIVEDTKNGLLFFISQNSFQKTLVQFEMKNVYKIYQGM